MLDVHKLHMLAELDRLGTIAAVARSLHLTAPGISMQLAALEREVGLPLTERQGRRIAVTPAGKILAGHGRDIIDMITVAEMETAALRDGAAGTYRVAAFPTAAGSIIARTWSRLIDDPESGISLRLIEMEPQDALPALAAGDVELAVAHSYSNMPSLSSPGLVATRIATESVELAVPESDPAAHSTEAVALGDFSRHGWIVPHRHWACYEMVQRACGVAGFEPRAVAEATDFSVQLALVAAGVGVALIPQLASATIPAGVKLLPLLTPVHRYDFLVSRQSSRADAGLARLQRIIADAAMEAVPMHG